MIGALRVGLALVVTSGLGCGSGDEMPSPAEGGTLTHTFPAFDVAGGEEIVRCQSWSLQNEEPLYVTSVTATNDGAWHHSNWFFVPPSAFRGDDGTWDCDDRGYSEAAAGFLGGVFFAQSTQALMEVQRFVPGAALRLPTQTRIVGGVHLLNASPTPLTTTLTLDVETAPESEVTTLLQPMSFTINHLDIRPRTLSKQTMACSLSEAVGTAPDFNIYYVLPHYHTLGTSFRLELTGGTRDGEVVYEVTSGVGEALGAVLDPPINVAGAEGIRATCSYDNPTDETVEFGIGDQEMCVFLAFTDSVLRFGAQSASTTHLGLVDGVDTSEAECTLYSAMAL
jgi:hypothetical protein